MEANRRRNALAERLRLGQVLGAKYLMDYGADVEKIDAKGHTPLLAAAAGVAGSSKRGDMVRELISAGARVDAVENITKNSPLHIAAELGSSDAVERLLRGGADLAAKNSGEFAPCTMTTRCQGYCVQYCWCLVTGLL